MDELKPYADSKSITIGGATIENDPDCVSISAGFNLTRDQTGLAVARKLKALLDAVVAALETDSALPAALPVNTPKAVRNPFD